MESASSSAPRAHGTTVHEHAYTTTAEQSSHVMGDMAYGQHAYCLSIIECGFMPILYYAT